MAESEARNLGTRTLRGMLWAYGSYVGGRVLTLVATAILARLLTPSEFGLVALAVLFMFLLETLSDLGVSQALVIVSKEEEEEHAETVFVWSLGLGAGFSALTAAASPLAAQFFNQPRLTGILAVLGLRFFIRSISVTHFALAQKRIDFRPRTAAQLSDVTTRGLTSIALAIAGLGVWSLVIGYLAGSIALTVVLWKMVPWRPHFRPQRAHLRSMLGFGGMLTGVNLISAIETNLDYLFIRRFLTASDLGLYSLGYRLPELLILNLSVVAGQVLFAAFAAIDREQLSRAFQVSLRYTLMIALPMAAGLAVMAHPLLLALFGDQWERSVPVMRVLTLYALAVAVSIPSGTIFKATGRAWILLAIEIPEAIMLVVALRLFVDDGIIAVAGCMAAVLGIFALVGTIAGMIVLGMGPRRVWAATWPPLVATAGMVAVLVPVERTIGSPWPALLTGVAAGGAVYLGLLWIVARDSLLRLRDMALDRGGVPEDIGPVTGTDAVA
jgi:O-antigen/teichoic acid export membrane protein